MVWLRRNFESEGAFLQQFDLSINKDKDRERGRMQARLMLRKIQLHDNEPDGPLQRDDGTENDSSGYDENSFFANSDDVPDAHLADHYFSQKELDWIQSHYHNSGAFLLMHSLRPSHEEDYEEGKLVLYSLMELITGDD